MNNFYWTYCLISVYFFINSVNLSVLLYDTDNEEKTQTYDCIYYDGQGFDEYNNPETTQAVKYCMRSHEFVSVDRNYSRNCLNGGILMRFEQLKKSNVNIKELFKWNSVVSVIDRYQAYLKLNQTTDEMICNCTRSGTFGILCEYQFSYETFEQTIQYQFNLKKKYPKDSQLFGNFTCYYTSFPCDYGMRCLDWREICDQKQQCIDGTDEDYCEHLLLNECDSLTEYRCRNGMCIDEEYFLDGDFDCQDRSDEILENSHKTSDHCPFVPNIDCDESLPYAKKFFSCGDGQIISEMYILVRLEITNNYYQRCISFRDKQWMCEIDSEENRMWTNPESGHCLDLINHRIDYDKENNCTLIIKCSFIKSDPQHQCPCLGNHCRTSLRSICHLENISYFEYPNGQILTPFIKNIYFWQTHDFDTQAQPDSFLFFKSIKCNSETRIPLDYTFNLTYEMIEKFLSLTGWYPFEYLFCYSYQFGNPNKQISNHCWNDTYPNQAFYCDSSLQYHCISKYEFNDGIIDCPLFIDELKLNSFGNCSNIVKHRFQCSNFNRSCLTVLNIHDDGYFQCLSTDLNENVEIKKKDLEGKKCKNKRSDDCQFLRQYIQQSSQQIRNKNSSSELTIMKTNQQIIKFRYYCDSIWDLSYGMDEIDCSQWKCPFIGLYRCQNGQCIPHNWLCDGEWDCSDGSDEEGFQFLTKQTIGQDNLNLFAYLSQTFELLKEQCLKKNSPQPFDKLCNLNIEYPCLLANRIDPQNLSSNRPCIHLTQIGDGHIDCHGGLDERNMLNCSEFTQLGFHLKCDSSSKCMPFDQRCVLGNQCQNKDDYLLCLNTSDNKSPSSNQIIDFALKNFYFDVICFNGTFVAKGKCNKIIECQFGEDEYHCSQSNETISLVYRDYKRSLPRFLISIHLPNYFPFTSKKSSNTTSRNLISETFFDIQNISKEGWICNRGVLGRKMSFENNQTEIRCFCPASYYGQRCQWMSNRLTIFTHFQDQTKTILKGVVNIVALFLMTTNNQTTILDVHQYYFTPQLNNLDEKHKFYFVYPNLHQLRSNKTNYSIRFESYLLNDDETIEFLAVWISSIPFHFLPSQRLTKILKYSGQFNQPESFCSNQFCSPTSLCRSNSNQAKPLCICSIGFYGPRCYLERQCQMTKGRNPCLNGGTCFHNYRHNNLIDSYICQCSQYYFGSKCERYASMIGMTFHYENQSILAIVIQLFDTNQQHDLLRKKQILFKSNRTIHSNIIYEQEFLPQFGLMKLYRNQSMIDYYLLYTSYVSLKSFNLTIEFNQNNFCPHTSQIFKENYTIYSSKL